MHNNLNACNHLFETQKIALINAFDSSSTNGKFFLCGFLKRVFHALSTIGTRYGMVRTHGTQSVVIFNLT